MKPADEEQELTRLLEGGSAPPLVLDALRERGPDATELASLANRLALQGIDVTVAKPALVRPARWKKWAAAGGGAALVGAGLLALRALPSTRPAASAPTALAAAADIATQAASPAARAPATVRRGAPAPSSSASAAPSAAAAAPAEQSSASGSAPVAAHEAAEPSRKLGVSQADTPSPEPRAAQLAGTAGARAAGSNAVGVPGEPAADPPLSKPTELSLLRDARLALAQSPARALELVEQHRRFYPGGKLTQERELIAMRALVAQGRRTAALERAAAFERAFPESPYRKQVSDLLR